MQTHYYNAFYSKDSKNDDGLFIESEALNYDDAVQEIVDSSFRYAYTIFISTEFIKRIDLESVALDVKYGEDNEQLTGHEMGICPRRV